MATWGLSQECKASPTLKTQSVWFTVWPDSKRKKLGKQRRLGSQRTRSRKKPGKNNNSHNKINNKCSATNHTWNLTPNPMCWRYCCHSKHCSLDKGVGTTANANTGSGCCYSQPCPHQNEFSTILAFLNGWFHFEDPERGFWLTKL